MPGTYEVGNVVRVTVSLFQANAQIDPGSLSLKLRDPNGGEYSNASPVKDSTGNYHVDYTIGLAGEFVYTWYAGSPALAVQSGSFRAIDPLAP